MDSQVQAFKDKMAEKAEAKQKVMAAVGEKDWKAVATHGISGKEGQLFAEAEQIAKDYVANNEAQFAMAASYSDPVQSADENGLTGHDKLVSLIDLFSKAGDEESALKLTMFELVKFERQEIGVTHRAKVRLGNGD